MQVQRNPEVCRIHNLKVMLPKGLRINELLEDIDVQQVLFLIEALSASNISSPPKPTVFISGVIARGDKDFPPAAAQVAHQKPHPSVEKHPPAQHVNQHIHQPRK
ncbi:death-associated protein 1-like [Lacerta agilis]|uniref:death-associated protein 1-like n=1 Tax=Lacerta agilis TaxID=80427 RepID=UPI0014192FF0|nr:death-associated protein 1-like [Lacerta agilis]